MKWIALVPWIIVVVCISIIGLNWIGIGAHSKKYIEWQNQATEQIEKQLQDCKGDTIQITKIKNGNAYFEKTIKEISTTTNYIFYSMLIVFLLMFIEILIIIIKRNKSNLKQNIERKNN